MSQIKTPISIRTFATDPNMLGLDLYPNQLKILESLYEKGTSRMVVAAGRRGGKSLISAVSTLYAAYIMQPIFAKALAPGEPYYCMVISATADQASRLLKRIRALIDNHSSMIQEIKSESATSIELYNGAIITSQTYSARGAVGNAVAHLVCDEMGRWMASGNHTNVDATEVLQAVTLHSPSSRRVVSFSLARPGCNQVSFIASISSRNPLTAHRGLLVGTSLASSLTLLLLTSGLSRSGR